MVFFESSPLKRGLLVAAIGLGLGLIVNLPSVLMPAYRRFYQKKFPEVAAQWSNNGSFTHFAYIGAEGEDQLGIGARVLDASRSLVPGDPYLGKPPTRRLATFDSGAFMALGLVQRLTGDLDRTWVVSRVLLSLLCFWAFFALLQRLGAGPAQSVFTAAVLTLFLDIAFAMLDPAADPVDLAKNVARKSLWLLGGDFYLFGPTHFVRPAMNYPAYAAACLPMVALRGAQPGPRGLAFGAAAGLAGGLLAYVHFDVWMVFCASAAVYLAALSLERRPLRPHGPALAACVTAALVSLPFFLAHFSARPEEFEARPFLIGGGFYRPSLVNLAAAWVFWRRRDDAPAWAWFSASQAAAFLLLNMSLLLPMGVQRYFVIFGANVTLLPGLAALLLRRTADSERWLWATAVVAALAVGRSVSYAAQLYPTYSIPRDYEAAFAWLKARPCAGKVLATLDGEVARLAPVHGGCAVLAVRANPFESDITNAENLRRTSYALDLFAAPKSRPAAVELFSRPGGQAILARQAWTGRYDRAEFHKRPAETLYFTGLYATPKERGLPESGRDIDFPAVLAERLSRKEGPYPVDFLWEGPLERGLRPAADKRPPGAGELVYENPSVRLFLPRAKP
ncbi:MAG: hypothetical protein HY928_00540 [Elusimicrobia bacterium]|nr:hypothetical protein [Elusimicrobiota bacterium]